MLTFMGSSAVVRVERLKGGDDKNLTGKLFSDSEATVLLKQLDFLVDSLQVKLLEKLEKSLGDLQLKTNDIENVFMESNDPKQGKVSDSIHITAHEVMKGYKRFFERTQLEQSDYLKDDCLSVHRSVGVKSHTEGPKIYSIAVPPSNINQHFGKLLESERGTDVSFEVDGEVFPAHKLVLATRSPVFWAQLFGPMKDQYTKQIKIEDIEAPVFKAVLHFMYWDSLPDMQELTGLNSNWSTARARMKIESGAWTRSAMDVDLNLLAVSAMVVEAANEVAALGPFHRERIVAGIVGGYRLCSIAYFEIPFRHFPHVVNRDGK
ncbi:hypothetical protein V6N11_000886 [Hibiscus sabdariffa]|uniref:BTB domain-containing protein n=1 Tax=Hibiscus sabdariffa TaxID=183260 RepID=A0ABR2RYG6_9ROSI